MDVTTTYDNTSDSDAEAESMDATTPDGKGDDGDLIGLISSFLGPSHDATGSHSQSQSQSSNPGPAPDALASSSAGDASPPPPRVVVFSKDRPWQLQELLRSMRLRPRPRREGSPRSWSMRILLHSSPEFRWGYEAVMRQYCDTRIRFLVEDDRAADASFASLLERSVAGDPRDGVVMFLTDDCLLLEPLEDLLATATGALREGAFNFVSRLHPGISWCQTRDIAAPPPRDEMRYRSLHRHLNEWHEKEDPRGARGVDEGVYFYDSSRAAGEWAYRFDLSGGVYSRGDVAALLEGMTAEEKSHPNLLEMRANQRPTATGGAPNGRRRMTRNPWTAIPTRPLLVVLAVNRVQDVCRAPLAPPQERSDVARELDPVSLLALLDMGRHLDVDKYRSRLYTSSHIGDFFLEHSEEARRAEGEGGGKGDGAAAAPARPKLSVLVPLHCGPPRAAVHALLSIVMQPIEELDLLREREEVDAGGGCPDRALLTPMQIVIVEDRCDDGSVEAIARSCEDVLRSRGVPFAWTDHRHGGQDSPAGARLPAISFDVIRSPRPGIACALNHGLRRCGADLVARMDADDVSTPWRLATQVRFMRAHPSFAAVGTSTVLFSAGNRGDPRSNLVLPCEDLARSSESYRALRPSLSISDPGFLAFLMFFSCAICHPSVVFRKNVIQELGGYDESISCCEDYNLWLRLIDWDSRSIVCLPFHGLWHRKHNQSISTKKSTIQKKEADTACYRAMERLFRSSGQGSSGFRSQVRTLRTPSSAQSSECLDLAAKLLQNLESSFVEKNKAHLSQREVALINMDCNERIGELATVLVTKFGIGRGSELDCNGPSTSFAWQLWCERCPDKQLERLSLLCHTVQSKQSDCA